MKDAARPLSTLVEQGWEVHTYHTSQDQGAMLMHSFLLRRQRDHKLLVVRRKVMGEGIVSEEIDL